jgi:hypothetical protein
MGIKDGRKKIKQLKVPFKCMTIKQILEMNKLIHLDLLGSFYTVLRDCPHSIKNIVLSLNESKKLLVWLDGKPTNQKKYTHVCTYVNRLNSKTSAHEK